MVFQQGYLSQRDGTVSPAALVTQFTIMPVVKEVDIDLQPGDALGCLNIDGKGSIPVAILGSNTFNVATVDVETLLFNGLTVKAKKHGKHQCSPKDIEYEW